MGWMIFGLYVATTVALCVNFFTAVTIIVNKDWQKIADAAHERMEKAKKLLEKSEGCELKSRESV